MAKKSKNMTGWGCLALFALPFLLVGLFVVGWTVWDVLRWYGARGWVETPATIKSADLEIHHGDDDTTYKAVARYTYEFGGSVHESDSVSLHGGADNIGTYQKDLAKELEELLRSGKPTVCYVDPDDPARAVLRRDFRPGLLALKGGMGALFASVGGGMLIGGIYARKKERQLAAFQERYPEEPWNWREDWAVGVVQPKGQVPVAAYWVVAVLWNFICWPLVVTQTLGRWEELDAWALLPWIFPAVGVGLLSMAFYCWLQRRRWGGSTFELADVPGVVGGKLAGVIHAPGGIVPDEGFQMTLSCIKKVTEQKGNKNSTSDKVLWQGDRVVFRELLADDPTATVIPVLFYVPFKNQSTSFENDVRWELDVSASVPGIGYSETFEVPVFKTEASSTDPPPEDDALSDYQYKPTLESAVAGCGAEVRRHNEYSLKIYFPRARNMGWAIGMTVFSAIWTAVCYALFKFDAPLIFPIVFSLVDLFLILFTLSMWLEVRELDVERGTLTVRSGWFGLGEGKKYADTEIRDVVIDFNMSSGKQVYHRLKVQLVGSKTRTICEGIRRRSVAELIREEILRVLLGE